VVRSDRELSAHGRVADLVPTASPLALGDEGAVAGRTFRVLGRLQLDHGRGPWDEWYVGFSDGAWGWLARAEGRWYVTFDKAPRELPPWDALAPGATIELSATGSVRWLVTERGGSALLSAEGELPFAIDPRASGRYADLEAEGGAFATIDYGDGSAPPQLFCGRELGDELTFKQTALGPRPEERVAVERLTCPACGSPVPIFVPRESERCGCAACGALLDHTRGALRLLEQLEPPAPSLIPLGSEGELLGERRIVVGFMQRHVVVEGDHYSFREYLLHGAKGYSWLVEDSGHWLHVAPIASSAVRDDGAHARYQGRRYRRFAAGRPEVDFVVGEFYWKVARGDRSETVDYIAPPRLLSVERTEREVSWSEGEYVLPAIVQRAFDVKQRLPTPSGVAPAQPNPHGGRGASFVFALLALLWLFIAFAYELGNRKQTIVETNLWLSPAESAEPKANTTFSPPFTVGRGPTTLRVELESPIDNGWVQVQSALIPEAGGEPRELPLVVEHYQGVSDGESWQEGDSASEGFFGGVPAGEYTLRFVASWQPHLEGGPAPLTPPPVQLRVTQGARSPACCAGAFALIALPWLLSRLRYRVFEQRRKENESA
jgi:hypothetical protein